MYCGTDRPAVWEAVVDDGGMEINLLLCEYCMGDAIRNQLDLSRWVKPETSGAQGVTSREKAALLGTTQRIIMLNLGK
jgi:hypothetical protein